MASNWKQLFTGITLVVSGFVLGTVYSNWSYDYHLLWETNSGPEWVAAALTHYKIKAEQPLFLHHVLHTVFFIGIFSLILKLYKPNESNYLFDGASLLLFSIGVIFYITNLRPASYSLRTGNWNDIDEETGAMFIAASQVLIVMAIVGVLSLQAGQWYAEAETAKRIAAAETKEQESAESSTAEEKPAAESSAESTATATADKATKRKSRKT